MTLRLLRDEKFPILERKTPELFPESALRSVTFSLMYWLSVCLVFASFSRPGKDVFFRFHVALAFQPSNQPLMSFAEPLSPITYVLL